MTEFSLIKEAAQILDQGYRNWFFYCTYSSLQKFFSISVFFSIAVFQIKCLVTDVSHYEPSHCVLIACVGTNQCPFPGPLQMIQEVRKNQQAHLRVLQMGGRCPLSVDFYFLQNNQFQIKCAVSDDVQSKVESRGFFLFFVAW